MLHKYFDLETYAIYHAYTEDTKSILDKYAAKSFPEQYRVIENRFLVPPLREPATEYPKVSSNLYRALNRHKTLQNCIRKDTKLCELYNE